MRWTGALAMVVVLLPMGYPRSNEAESEGG
jgi:hypothetical protein